MAKLRLAEAQAHFRHVGHAHRHAVDRGHRDGADVVERLHQADAAHHQLLRAGAQQAAADVGVAGAERLRLLRQQRLEAAAAAEEQGNAWRGIHRQERGAEKGGRGVPGSGLLGRSGFVT